MKKFFGLSLIAAFIALSTMPVTIVSCTKDTDTIQLPPDTVIDTVIIKDTCVNLDILTANPWKIQEIRGVAANLPIYYLRGGAANLNTESFDNEYITFNADKTGEYTDNNGGKSALTWDFANDRNTKVVFTVNFPDGAVTLTWDHIGHKNDSIRYEEYYFSKGINKHAYGIRIPK